MKNRKNKDMLVPKLFKKSIVCIVACFIFNSAVHAETVTITGTAYGSRTSTEETVLSDGNFNILIPTILFGFKRVCLRDIQVWYQGIVEM